MNVPEVIFFPVVTAFFILIFRSIGQFIIDLLIDAMCFSDDEENSTWMSEIRDHPSIRNATSVVVSVFSLFMVTLVTAMLLNGLTGEPSGKHIEYNNLKITDFQLESINNFAVFTIAIVTLGWVGMAVKINYQRGTSVAKRDEANRMWRRFSKHKNKHS